MLNGWLGKVMSWGPVATIAFFLLFQSAGYIPSVASEIKDISKQHQTEANELHKATVEALKAVVAEQKEASRLLRIQCLKAAQTDQDRQNCL